MLTLLAVALSVQAIVATRAPVVTSGSSPASQASPPTGGSRPATNPAQTPPAALAAAPARGPSAGSVPAPQAGAAPLPQPSVPVRAPSVAPPSGSIAVPAAPLHRNPTVRIGLTTDPARAVVTCAHGFRVTDADGGAAVWKDVYKAPLTIGVRGARPLEARVFRVQVGSFATREAAETLASRIRAEVGDPVVVAWQADRRVWRVRAGEADSRPGLADLVTRLKKTGLTSIWIGDEPAAQQSPGQLVLVDEDYNTMPVLVRALSIEPVSPDDALAVNGSPYRGSFEVRLDPSGALRVIDVVPLESYLRGVVPSELGPAQYPELDALKAQTVAARTYVYRNLGQFAEEGYDLCDTPRCQVYGGMKAEHPLSDRAVRETEGEIAVYEGRPIDALYTSTCGGHTEDAAEVFPELAAPYLVGVACAPETGSRKSRRIVLEGVDDLVRVNPDAARAASILAVHGLVLRAVLRGDLLGAAVPAGEADAWIGAVVAACGTETGAGGKTAHGLARGSRRARGRKAHAAGASYTGSAGSAVAHRPGAATRISSSAEAGLIGSSPATVPAAPSSRNNVGTTPYGEGSPAGVPGAGEPAAAEASPGSPRSESIPGDGVPPSVAGEDSERRGAALPTPGAVPTADGHTTLAALAAKLVSRLGWGPRVSLLVGGEEASDWVPDGAPALSESEINAVAYFLKEKSWPSAPDGSASPARVATRGDLARLLLFAAEACDLTDLHEGIVRGGGVSGLRISGKDVPSAAALAPGALMFSDAGAGPVPVGRLGLLQGDKIVVHLAGDGRIDFLQQQPGRQGLSDDRFSGTSSWHTAYTAADLGKRLDEYLGSGDLLDIVPVRRGVSGRVTELKVVGTEGERTISGFDIRTALGLKENLFVIDKQKNRDGGLRRIVFTGRGWGHGVGMCQIGAYGMALRGASYRSILTHYYSGIAVERVP